jgi:hypothetical protein
MRPRILLLPVIVFILLAAPAASMAQTSSAPKSLLPSAGDSAAILRPDGSNLATLSETSSKWKFYAMNSQPVCYTMRTYVVARDTPGSDSTHAAGYQECLPSWKLDMRTSDLKGTGPGVPLK